MSVIDLLRQATARRAAVYAYAASHDRFSELEQLYTDSGEPVMAAGAHEYALLALKAYRAEVDDPEPAA